MIIPLRTLTISSFLLVFACGKNAGEQTAPPVVTQPVASTAAAAEVPQRKEEVTEIPAAARPPVANAATPDRDATRTEDQAVIEERKSMDRQQPTPPGSVTSPAPAPAPPSEPESAEAIPATTDVPEKAEDNGPDHASWNEILQQYVDAEGKVDYAGLKKNETKLDNYLAILAKTTPDKRWSRDEGLAYWINAYNAFTFKLILNNYPVNSITDLDGGDPWKVKWIKLGDQTYSLNNIEHDIIRPRYQDPRIHFALVCAATSCPPLLNKAFEPENLQQQLDLVTRKFIGNSTFNQLEGDVRISKIFDWYAEDFGDVRAFLNRYSGKKVPAGKEIGFMGYDWSLNKQ